MKVAAVYACVNIISQSLAMVPLVLYKGIDAEGRRLRDENNPLFSMLYSKPNAWQTSFEWRWMMQSHLLLRGNAYSEIVPSGTRGIGQLIPLHPDRVTPFWVNRDQGKIAYKYNDPSGTDRIILAEEMLHLRNLSLDGLIGLTPITLHRESIGLSMVTQEHGARVFSNGAQVGSVLKHPDKLSAEAHARLRKQFEDRYTGNGNAHKTAILEEGMTLDRIALTNEDAQYLETRVFQRQEIASIFRTPLHMIGDLEHATFSNIEQQSLEFVTFTMLPWVTCWEQAIMRDLLGGAPGSYVKFVMQMLMRGDTPSRYASYTQGRMWGWLSVNDVRTLEDMDPINGGDVYLTPLNMVPADTPVDKYLKSGNNTPGATNESQK